MNKYMLALKVAVNIVKGARKWKADSEKEDSPGGKEITVEEKAKLMELVLGALVDVIVDRHK